MRSVIAAIPVVLLLAGCQQDAATPSTTGERQREQPTVQASNVLKVTVTSGGDITADGQPVTLDQLALKFAELKESGGAVWYHRENPAGEPHPNAMKVIALLIENKLPVRLSAKPDFSDAVWAESSDAPDPALKAGPGR